MKKIILAPKKEESIRRRHPWIFSGAIRELDPAIQEGDRVTVYSAGGEFLATGHYQEGSIRVRIFDFNQAEPKQSFWNKKLQDALTIRKTCGLLSEDPTNSFRLIHGEGDGLPGLIIDIYHDTAVIQCHSIGMYREQPVLTVALQQCLGDRLKAIYSKSKASLPQPFSNTVEDGYLFGGLGNGIILENGHRFFVDWEAGQKTGFFLDQRENRRLAGAYAGGKKVLNAFCYSGGFSVYALAAGAHQVDSVDVSSKAIEWTSRNVNLNGNYPQHNGICADVRTFLKSSSDLYDLAIIDPPAFAKNIGKRHQAVQGYKRLNTLAINRMAPGSVLFTFSCSQVIDERLFYNTVVAAAIDAGRDISVLHRLTQPPDHPPSLFHPEGSYLKGLALWVR